MDTYGFQKLIGEHTSHIYIEGIRYITVHQIPPIAGQSCLNMYAAQVWFGNALDQWCLPPFEIPKYWNSPSTLPWDTSQHVSTDSSTECTEWSESKSKRRKIKVWPVTDVKSTIQSPWSQPNPLNCKPQVLNCNPPFAIKELGFAMKDFSLKSTCEILNCKPQFLTVKGGIGWTVIQRMSSM